MGLNRKMDRRICFGPRSLGGLKIIKIEYDQFLKHLLCMRKHVISASILKALMTYQTVIGCDDFFFLTKNPNVYVYRPASKHNSITYLWDKIVEIRGKRTYPKYKME